MDFPGSVNQSALSLRVLSSSASYFAVRMTIYSRAENLREHGQMLWPEFLVCSSQRGAVHLCQYLNNLSYQDSRSIWIEEEPYLEESELRQRWLIDEAAIYEVVFVESLSSSPDLYRLAESLKALERINKNLILA